MSLTETPIADLVDLRGRNALVIGGANGIGPAIARRLAEAGAHVTIADMASERDSVAAEIGGAAVDCDITDPVQLVAALAAATRSRLDIVVNNAGIYPTTGPMMAATDEFVQRMLNVNVRAQYSACREAATACPVAA